MSHDHRRNSSSGTAVHTMNIRSANTASHHLYQYLVILYYRIGNIFINKLIIFFKYECLHKLNDLLSEILPQLFNIFFVNSNDLYLTWFRNYIVHLRSKSFKIIACEMGINRSLIFIFFNKDKLIILSLI